MFKKILVGVLFLPIFLQAGDIFGVIKSCKNIANPKAYNFNKTDKEGETPLTKLSKLQCQNRIEIAKSIIDNSNILDKPNAFGDTPLLFAIRNKSPYLAKLFIKEGADINIASKKDGKTALMLATLNKDKDLVRILCERHAKRGVKDIKGYTALDYAIKEKLGEIAQDIYADKRGKFIFFKKGGKPIFLKLTRKGFVVKDKNIDKKRILFAYVDAKVLKKLCKSVKDKDMVVLAMVSYDSDIKKLEAKKCKNIKLLNFNKKFYLLLMKTLRWRTPPLFLLRDKNGRIVSSGIDKKFLSLIGL